MTSVFDLPKLSSEQIAFFRENGYIQILNLLTPTEVERIKATIYRAIEKQKLAHEQIPGETREENLRKNPAVRDGFDPQQYARVFEQRVNLWQYDDEMREITQDRRFAELARQLVGCRAIRLFHDHALIKQSGDNRATNWHQDTPYWPMNENGGLSIWIALDDVSDDNGCLHFIARSRNIDRLNPQLLGPDDVFGGIEKEVSKDDASAEKKLVRETFQAIKRGEHPELLRIMKMPAGSVTFHDGLTLHYANANKTEKPRHALAIIYIPDGITYSGASHPMTDDLDLTVGAPLAHARFPIIATAS